jgi:adenosylcobinamide kinase/adenosylcobinamide-phosphate guanylyltransferase
MGRLVFITGGARSGKSRLAERIAAGRGGPVVYLATLQPLDDEMRARVAEHRNARPREWRTVEEPLDLVPALEAARPFATCLLDCVTLWVSNLLLAGTEPLGRVRSLLEWQQSQQSTLIVVSNEAGAGVVPEYEIGRRFRDALGEANQLICAEADEAYLCLAGRALDLKALGRPIAGF